MLTLISDAFDASLEDKLKKFGDVTTDTSRVKDADVILIRSKTKATQEYLDEAKNLKLIIRGGVGIDNIDTSYCDKKGIKWANTPKASGVAVAELAFAHMLNTASNFVYYDTTTRAGGWNKKVERSELCGKTLSLIGFGNIAQEVAKRALAFGMNVQAFARHTPKMDGVKACKSLEDAVKNTDYISIHLPLTNETRDMFNSSLFAKMQNKPVIINTGRGACVNTADLCKALEVGTVKWYCADVFEKEPLENDNALLKQKNVTLTPHVGANTTENLLRIGEEVIETINKFKKEGLFK